MAKVLSENFKEVFGNVTNSIMFIIFYIAIFYSMCMFIGDTLDFKLPNGTRGFEAGFVLMVASMVIVFILYVAVLMVKAILDFMFVDTEEEARKYLEDRGNRLTKDILSLNFDYNNHSDNRYLLNLVSIYKNVMEEHYNLIARCDEPRYLFIVIHNYCLVYIKVTKIDKEPVILKHDQLLEDYLKKY